MATPQEPSFSALQDFLSSHPHITHATPSAPNYASLRSSYIIDDDIRPALIVRPQSADDVAELICVLTANSIPFTIRSGGHDMFSRSLANGTVTIDMRDIAYVKVDKESQSARIGGGVLVQDLAAELDKEGFVTPSGTIPAVGYVGWATHGGYGPLSANYGLGADQIQRAKLVNAQGKIIDADEKLLKGLRGGGGTFGVIVELTIKVYPLETVSIHIYSLSSIDRFHLLTLPQALGGLILYQSEDLVSTIKQFNDGYRTLSAQEGGLPPALGANQAVVNSPAGRVFGLLFLWSSSDIETGKIWLEKILSLAPVAMHTVTTTTVAEWLTVAGSLVGKQCYGPILSVNLRTLTPEAVDVMGKHAQQMPSDPSVAFGIHQLRGPATQDGHPDSVFPERSAHFMLEILPTVASPENLDAAVRWGTEFREALLKTSSDNLLPTVYFPFVSPEKLDIRQVFQEQYDALVHLKREYDPKNIFKFALVQI
jgi:hypothetical protein